MCNPVQKVISGNHAKCRKHSISCNYSIYILMRWGSNHFPHHWATSNRTKREGGGGGKNNKQKDHLRVLLMCRPVLCTSNACRLLQKPRTLLSPSQSTKSAQSVTDIQPDNGDTHAHPKHINVQYSGLVCLLLSTCTHWCISCVCLSHTSVPTATDRWIPAHTAAVQCVGPLLAAPHGCFCCFMLSCAACSWGLIL